MCFNILENNLISTYCAKYRLVSKRKLDMFCCLQFTFYNDTYDIHISRQMRCGD